MVQSVCMCIDVCMGVWSPIQVAPYETSYSYLITFPDFAFRFFSEKTGGWKKNEERNWEVATQKN